ncbi:phosphate ABC transporter substrate-binding protein [Clostridium sardiniense]|uniref:Phosphate-binding protein n=1 Tax=Clostridium sardiniense TaxID=29369 RepID=A0ABS7KXG0_CLOSR|nr:phosphate ABC transporter substrate-binding protein [Clostridium sardiniense]MBY0755503.1 phosphate ABC transporter substrate-binding protein [Clostridium sardiniense]MDQ0460890.1 phosphate transport system substrate-binding protein [Clostridium sardiniense]
MRKKNLKMVVTALAITMVGGIFVGCGSGTNNAANDGQTITISGSSALLPLMEQSIEKFNEIKPGNTINAQAGGSGTGLTQVLEGSVNIGNSDVLAESKLTKEQASELVDHKVVAQGFGVVVNKAAGITNLTKKQIQDIFSGKVKNWKEVGGKDMEILVIHRPASSGTRATFTEKVLDGKKELENDSIGAVQDSNGAVLNAMKQNDGAISYVALSYMNNEEAKKSLDLVKIDGAEPTVDNIKSGNYKFWSWGHMYTKGEANGLSKEFIDFVGSKENSESINNLGLIPGNEIKE